MLRFMRRSPAVTKDALQLLAASQALINAGDLAIQRSANLVRRARALLTAPSDAMTGSTVTLVANPLPSWR
jgi:hypothetical protein